jgi:serine/threonine protein kinase
MEKPMENFPDIPGCKILSKLGEGGAANVYLGIQENLNRKVAIKVLHPHLLKNKDVAARFKKGAKTAANLSHSSIVQIYDIGKDGDYHHIIMEYLEESLKDRLERSPERKMPPESALSIVEKMMQALDYAHLRGVYHRDLKPDNIMFKHDNTPVLVDFGIARVFDSADHKTQSDIIMIMGTVYYMSPEQCRSKQVDGRSDIYSLGVILYEMLTGEKPYKQESMIALALQHIEEPVPKLPSALRYYQPLIDKMMAKDKQERITSYPEYEQLVDKIPKVPVTHYEYEISIDTEEPVEIQYSDETHTPQPPGKNFISDKIKAAYLLLKNQAKGIKLSFKKSPALISIKEKLSSFIRDIKKNLGLFILWMKKKLLSTREHISQRQLLSGALTVILMLSISTILFILGSQGSGSIIMSKSRSDSTSTNSSISYTTLYKLFTQTLPYHICLDISREFYKKGDMESAKKAMVLINVLKKIEPNPPREVNQLEEQVTDKIESAMKYEEHLANICKYIMQKNSSRAQKSVAMAKKMKNSSELEVAETICTEYATLHQNAKQYEKVKQDNQAYIRAFSQNNTEAYKKYLREFANGLHVKEATSKLEELIKSLIKEPIELRAQKRILDKYHVKLTIERYDFFEQNLNKNGAFKGDYKKIGDNGSPVVIDRKTNLMWHDGKPSRELTFKKAEDWIENLNQKNYAGYNDWRLPTLEEAASLLRKKKNDTNEMYIDPIFTGDQKRIWTKDSFSEDEKKEKEKWWVVLFYFGTIYRYPNGSEHHVRPVRSLK